MTTFAFRLRQQLIPFIVCLTACSGSTPDVDQALTTPIATRVAAIAEPPPSAQLNQQDAVETLTGGRTRVVWIRDLGDGTDFLGFGDQVLVMGFDTGDELGERAIVETPGTYAKPLITPRGDRVVYTNRREHSVRVVDWSGERNHRLLDGFPLAVWIDPDTGVEWVYAGTDAQGTDPESYGEVHSTPDRPSRDRRARLEQARGQRRQLPTLARRPSGRRASALAGCRRPRAPERRVAAAG